jgi:hypothetical protein
MTKKTKTLLGVGAVAVVGYLLWKQSQKKKPFLGEFKSGLAARRGMAAAKSNRAQLMNKYSEAFGRPNIGRNLGSIPGIQMSVASSQAEIHSATGCSRGGSQTGAPYMGYTFYSDGNSTWGCDRNGNKASITQLQQEGVLK